MCAAREVGQLKTRSGASLYHGLLATSLSASTPDPPRVFREAARDLRTVLSASNLQALCGLMMLVVGVPLLGAALWLGYRQYAILHHWLEVEAVAESTVILEYAPSRGAAGGPSYRVQHVLLYSVGGEQHRATVLEPWSGTTHDIGLAKRLAQAFPEGTRRKVRCNPDDPGEIWYETHAASSLYRLPVTVGVAALGLLIIGGLLRRWSRRKAESLCIHCGLPVLTEQRFCPHCGRPQPIG